MPSHAVTEDAHHAQTFCLSREITITVICSRVISAFRCCQTLFCFRFRRRDAGYYLLRRRVHAAMPRLLPLRVIAQVYRGNRSARMRSTFTTLIKVTRFLRRRVRRCCARASESRVLRMRREVLGGYCMLIFRVTRFSKCHGGVTPFLHYFTPAAAFSDSVTPSFFDFTPAQ